MYFIKDNFFKFCNQFEVVIFSANLHYISFCFLPFLVTRKFKTISWSMGIRASYQLRFDLERKKKLIDFIYGCVLKYSDASIFYMKETISFWKNLLNYSKIFIAHNTIDVDYSLINKNVKKNTILFIGTLYKEKKIYELLNSYLNVNNDFNYILEIIGDGDELINLQEYILKYNLADKVILRGRILDENDLAKSFNRSIVCISPDQAGLSVLKSMGYGVPFITRVDAITGGERLNIKNRINGVLYKDEESLVSILNEIFMTPEYFLQLGENAREYYLEYATIEKMANGFIDSINYVINKKIYGRNT